MTTELTSTDLARTAEAAAPGRVSYDLARSRTITIASTDGTSQLRVGLTDDPVDGGDCVLAVTRSLVDFGPGVGEGWDEGDSVDVPTLADLEAMITALG